MPLLRGGEVKQPQPVIQRESVDAERAAARRLASGGDRVLADVILTPRGHFSIIPIARGYRSVSRDVMP